MILRSQTQSPLMDKNLNPLWIHEQPQIYYAQWKRHDYKALFYNSICSALQSSHSYFLNAPHLSNNKALYKFLFWFFQFYPLHATSSFLVGHWHENGSESSISPTKNHFFGAPPIRKWRLMVRAIDNPKTQRPNNSSSCSLTFFITPSILNTRHHMMFLKRW